MSISLHHLISKHKHMASSLISGKVCGNLTSIALKGQGGPRAPNMESDLHMPHTLSSWNNFNGSK